MTYLQALILAVIEGVTEFLPVSSTGHMILADALMGGLDREFVKTFEIVIQLGAILAVLCLYARRFMVGLGIYYRLLAAFLPTAIVGLLAYDTIKAHLFNPYVVSASLIAGGVALILLDRWSARQPARYASTDEIPPRRAALIGLAQCLSMVPGVSRAAATILGGIAVGFDRRQAAEFSFLLAIPTMMAAASKDLWESRDAITADNVRLLLFGGAIAFVVALVAVKAFIAFLTRHGFAWFGYYRIAIGVAFLLFALTTGLQLHA